VETYWKSTAVSAISPSTSSKWPHRSHLIGSAQTSPSNHSIFSISNQASTVSSLRGRYIYVVIQVTRDLQPVVFSHWVLPETGYTLGVADVTLSEFEALALRVNRNVVEPPSNAADWPGVLSSSMISLTHLLKVPSSASVVGKSELKCHRSCLPLLVLILKLPTHQLR
jgi:CDK inhibitor PHO81